jgi:long-chain acyl-CoA synthetase
MNLTTAFRNSALARPSKVAVFWGDQEFSYDRIWEMSVFVSGQLRDAFQIKPGDRVALWLKNCPEFIPAYFGILHCGAVVVPINNFLKPPEVAYILRDAEATVLITDSELEVHAPVLAAAGAPVKIWNVKHLSTPVREAISPSVEMPSQQSDDLAVLIYTSGTTGHPKGAMLSHGNLLHNVESCRVVLQTVEMDRFAVLLPLFHSYMMTVGMLLPLIVGGSIVLIRSVHPPRNAIAEVIRHQATVLPAIPQFYRSLTAAGDPKLPLRLCVSGAAPLPVKVLEEFEQKFHIPIIEGYGLSEASPVVTKNPLDGRRKPGSIGLPIHDVEVSVQDDSGNLLDPHQVGEICVRGGNVMLGYWKKPEETTRAMRGKWLLTGDVGYRDEEGYYYITDRKKDMLLVNGCNVYPREIEEVLYHFPGVKEAAVIGVPDSRRGEQPVAFVSANEGTVLDEDAIQEFVRSQLADYKVPKKVILLSALPRNATGKILKTSLRQIPVSQ